MKGIPASDKLVQRKANKRLRSISVVGRALGEKYVNIYFFNSHIYNLANY